MHYLRLCLSNIKRIVTQTNEHERMYEHTVGCRDDAVRYNMILHTGLH